MSENSDTFWLELLKRGEDRAATPLWERYFDRLVRLAHRRLSASPRRTADAEDVALSAFHSFCRGAGKANFTQLEDRNDLWQVLAVITSRKAIRQMKRERALKRGGGHVRGESVFLAAEGGDVEGNIAQFVEAGPDPQFQGMIQDEFLHLLELLDDQQLRDIALMKLEGYTNQQIADHFGRNVRSIERKLQLIRMRWERDEKHDGP